MVQVPSSEMTLKQPFRLLLIDHYDSYTLNLYHTLMDQVPNAEIIVLHHDSVSFEQIMEALPVIDAILLSPGPGTPLKPSDLGVTGMLLEQVSNVPFLGVCFGHQAMAHIHGAIVTRAPTPVHGCVSAIQHDGKELFRGLPQPFHVVRYHSLIAQCPLPECLVMTAETIPGQAPVPTDPALCMALKHKTKPMWGVQFHPESIGTEAGALLLRNFYDLAMQYNENHRFLEQQCISAWNQLQLGNVVSRPLPIEHEMNHFPIEIYMKSLDLPAITMDQLFQDFFGQDELAFWLDSANGERADQHRFSYLGSASSPGGALLRYHLLEKTLTVTGSESNTLPLSCPNGLFPVLKQWMHCFSNIQSESIHYPRFVGGLVGYFGYEMRFETEHGDMKDFIPTGSLPESAFLHIERLLAVDHLENKLFLIHFGCEEDNRFIQPLEGVSLPLASKQTAYKWIHEMEMKMGSFMPQLFQSVNVNQIQFSFSDESIDQDDNDFSKPETNFRLAHSVSDAALVEKQFWCCRDDYLERIKQVHECIRSGDTYEVCLTTQWQSDALKRPLQHQEALQMFLKLRQRNQAPMSAYLPLGENAFVLSASPERFISLDAASGQVRMKPIKGTVARHPHPELDRLHARFLQECIKDRSENLMIVDLIRHDLTHVCVNVTVPHLMAIESFATVHQMVSTVQGDLKEQCTALDAVMATFPPGSMTGAPKKRTCEIMHALEQKPRGVYSGALGYLSISGDMDLNVVIRSAVIDTQSVTVGAGGAIVILSDPTQEVDEVVLKASSTVPSVQFSLLEMNLI